MERDDLILEGIDRLERRVAPLTATAQALSELRSEMAPRVNEAVQALIRELADVEADFQLEELFFLVKKAMRNVKNFSFALDQMKNLIDFTTTVEPLLKSSVPQMIQYLDGLERNGVFRLLTLGLDVLKKIGAMYSEQEMEKIGAGVVRLAGTLRHLTRPESLEFLERAAQLPARVDLSAAKEAGPFRMLWAMGDHEVKQGLGVLLELTRGLAGLKTEQTP
jgi:uncharacterized protein YjgD (DUF1641 family)